ncbi:hypothetical protein DPEC_G00348820 [Dallia pectoralis]|uniref:Uncharacterized protein n=1 Tax=Dallia pectoralis TaxID=75939 RepID=A0ACC2F179_DALPE|nr:hypothetical protein DPEC_G00348820 [Dallia pectoralis]
MASVELLYIDKGVRGGQPDPPCVLDWASNPVRVGKGGGGGALSGEHVGLCNSAPRTAPHNGTLHVEKVKVCCDDELETSFTHVDETVNVRPSSPGESVHRPVRNDPAGGIGPEWFPELSVMSDDDLALDSPGPSVDYGFISAVTFLVAGISLMIVSYAVPREVQVDPGSVSAREMERLESECARVGAHLDRCVIAGLCLLTLGGVVLSSLLMVSMWKGEMYRRKAFAHSKHSAKLYGSFNLKTKSSPSSLSVHLEPEIDETPN